MEAGIAKRKGRRRVRYLASTSFRECECGWLFSQGAVLTHGSGYCGFAARLLLSLELFAELAGGVAGFFAEDFAEIFRVVESGETGDGGEREVGFDQQRLGSVDLESDDFGFGGASEPTMEPSFEHAARQGDRAGHILHADRLVEVFSDESYGLGGVVVFNGEDIGGSAGDHAAWWDVDRIGGGGLTVHELIEHGSGVVADLFGVDIDTGERGIGQSAEQQIVVHGDNGDLIGHGEFGSTAGVQDLLAPFVMAGHQPQRFRQRVQPLSEGVLLLVPACTVVFMDGVLIDLAGVSSLFDVPDEAIATYIDESVVASGGADKGELTKAPVDEVVGGHTGDDGVVDADKRQGEVGERSAKIDDGDGGAHDGSGHGAVVDTGKDAVAFPVFEPSGGGVVEAAWFDID